jgi:tripartite-type tricarboxylate transporter receptor subunit TctC
MTKHIPGNPIAIPQNMLGAGSRKAANWLYNVAPRDGSVIGVITQSTPLDHAIKQPGVQFDASRFNWIGNPIVDNQIFLAWAESGVRTLEEAVTKGGLVCGGTGASTNPVIFPKIINQMLGSNIRIVAGYPGAAAITLAMERGEVNCIGSHSWSTAKATMARHLSEGNVNVLVQWGPAKDPEISLDAKRDVPLILDYARNDMEREVLKLIDSSMAIGRPLLTSPDVPHARVEALRHAFDETMKDAEFLAEAKRLSMDIKPMGGADLQKLATEVAHASPEVVERTIALTQ